MQSPRTAKADTSETFEQGEFASSSAVHLESRVIAKSDRQDSDGDLRVNDAFLRPNFRESVTTEVKVNPDLFAVAKEALREAPPASTSKRSRVLYTVGGVAIATLAACAALAFLRS